MASDTSSEESILFQDSNTGHSKDRDNIDRTDLLDDSSDCSIAGESPNYYLSNFKEIRIIGTGGFGSVYKARFILDKAIYAVKKIPFNLSSAADYQMVIREAESLASLKHVNIVRYHSAWIERDTVYKDDDLSDESLEDSASNKISRLIPDSSSSSPKRSQIKEKEKKRQKKKSRSSHENSEESILFQDSNTGHSKDRVPAGSLYIKMEYCEADLRAWLDARACGNKLPFDMTVQSIFHCIVNGLNHIHSKSIIHRDLKPCNIFYSNASSTIKIGDFGLATLSNLETEFSNHSPEVGTTPYAAPEQIHSDAYNFKVDIYSVGIILIELINLCEGGRGDFARILDSIKSSGTVSYNEGFQELASLVPMLISSIPNSRPTTCQIIEVLQDKSEKEKDMQIESLSEEVIYLKNENSCLKAELDAIKLKMKEMKLKNK